MRKFSDLKNMGAKLQRKLEEMNKGTADDRFWYPERGDDGNAYAKIRFLPPIEGEDAPYVKRVRYKFRGPGGLYNELSRTTIGQSDPVALLNSTDYMSGEEGKLRAKARRQNRTYITNVYVIHDSSHPEYNGKVKLFRFGISILEKLNIAMNPPTKDIDAIPINPYMLIAPPSGISQEQYNKWVKEYGKPGADFSIRIKTKAGEEKYADWSASSFLAPSTLGNFDEDRLEEICSQCYALNEFIDPKNFKSFEELEKKLQMVLGSSQETETSREENRKKIEAALSRIKTEEKTVDGGESTDYISDGDVPWKDSEIKEEDDDGFDESFFEQLTNKLED